MMVKQTSLELVVLVRDGAVAEQLVAEVWAAGASGILEEDVGGELRLTIYFLPTAEPRVIEAVEAFDREVLETGVPAPVEDKNWEEGWKEGLTPVQISPTLWIRPTFSAEPTHTGGVDVLIDPGQAFGTGRHESTVLALEWVDALAEAAPMSSVLDVGTGSGVLALAALRRGARRALGFDTDRVAVAEARRNAQSNGLSSMLDLFAGPIQAVGSKTFPVVLVNLLRTEMDVIASEIAARVDRRLVLSGLLESELQRVIEHFSTFGLTYMDARHRTDESGAVWSSLLLARD